MVALRRGGGAAAEVLPSGGFAGFGNQGLACFASADSYTVTENVDLGSVSVRTLTRAQYEMQLALDKWVMAEFEDATHVTVGSDISTTGTTHALNIVFVAHTVERTDCGVETFQMYHYAVLPLQMQLVARMLS